MATESTIPSSAEPAEVGKQKIYYMLFIYPNF